MSVGRFGNIEEGALESAWRGKRTVHNWVIPTLNLKGEIETCQIGGQDAEKLCKDKEGDTHDQSVPSASEIIIWF